MKVSIVVPCYNQESYIEKAIHCVLSQTYTNLECIVINDGSTDDSKSKITPFLSDARVKYFYQANKGLSQARNKGIEMATGTYLYFYDPDDLLSSNTIELLVNHAEKAEVISGNIGLTKGQNKEVYGLYRETLVRNQLIENTSNEILDLVHLESYAMMAWNKLFRTSFIKGNNLKFKPGLLHEDQLWFFELILYAKSFYLLDDVTYFYNKANTGSITSSITKKNIDAYITILETIYNKYYRVNKYQYLKPKIGAYLIKLKIGIINNVYALLDSRDRENIAFKLKVAFEKIKIEESVFGIDKKQEELLLEFKAIERLTVKQMQKFLRYKKSPKGMRPLKIKILLVKACLKK